MFPFIGIFAVLTSAVVRTGIHNAFVDSLTSWHPCLSHFLYTEGACTHTCYDVLHTLVSFNHFVLVYAPKIKWRRVRAHRAQVTRNSSYFNPYHHILSKGPWGCYRQYFIVLFLPGLKTRCDWWIKCLVNRKLIFCLLNPNIYYYYSWGLGFIILEVLLHSLFPTPLQSNVFKAE